MSKELEEVKIIKQSIIDMLDKGMSMDGDIAISLEKRLDIIETALKDYEKKLEQAQEDKEMLDIFKNALTIERDIPPELEIKESEKGCSYVFKEAVKIHENRIEEMLKKSLREWVLKNAFPKELKALEFIKEKQIDVFDFKRSHTCEYYNYTYAGKKWRELTKQEFELLKEVLL